MAGLYRVPDIDAAIELVNGTEFGSSPSLSRRSGCRTAATLTRDAGRAEPEHRPAGSPAQPPRDEDLPAQAEHGRPAHRLRQAFSPARQCCAITLAADRDDQFSVKQSSRSGRTPDGLLRNRYHHVAVGHRITIKVTI